MGRHWGEDGEFEAGEGCARENQAARPASGAGGGVDGARRRGAGGGELPGLQNGQGGQSHSAASHLCHGKREPLIVKFPGFPAPKEARIRIF